jgi:splicing factor, arginine/serine-rich 16
MPWLGQKDNLIDRFDARAHLDYIPPIQKPATTQEPEENDEASTEERLINYERYRVLAQNDFLGKCELKKKLKNQCESTNFIR